ncbi:hypothetical protein [Ciceribacter azotifigens]|uniref:hypothetical protein n=1 Tax=Ciceribacter azotifigens TaxID=2069303 RepID=UPI003A892FC0
MTATASRVRERTAPEINRRIDDELRERIHFFANMPQYIDARLRTLDEEWDVERVLEANAATFSLLGLVLGSRVDRRFYGLSALVATFLLQHAVHGWCPPLPILRRLGFRTAAEIERERYALKALRGDFVMSGSMKRDLATILRAVGLE